MFYVNCLQQFMIISFILHSSVPFIFLVQNLTPEIPPEDRYEVGTCISTYRTCTLSILINTLDQFLMPEEAFQTTGSVG